MVDGYPQPADWGAYVVGRAPRKARATLVGAISLLRRSGRDPVLAVIGGHSFQDYREYRERVLALIEGREARCSIDRALHGVDIMTSILKSGEEGRDGFAHLEVNGAGLDLYNDIRGEFAVEGMEDVIGGAGAVGFGVAPVEVVVVDKGAIEHDAAVWCEGGGESVGGVGRRAAVTGGAGLAFTVGFDGEAGEVGDELVDFSGFVRPPFFVGGGWGGESVWPRDGFWAGGIGRGGEVRGGRVRWGGPLEGRERVGAAARARRIVIGLPQEAGDRAPGEPLTGSVPSSAPDIAQLEARASTAPTDVPTHLALADAYLDADRLSDASTTYRQVLDIDKDNVDALNGLAIVLYRADQPDVAMLSLDRVLTLNPKEPNALFLKGLIQYREQDWKGAAATWKVFLDVGQFDPRASMVRPLYDDAVKKSG